MTTLLKKSPATEPVKVLADISTSTADNLRRVVEVTMRVEFAENNRRVTPADIDKAAKAALDTFTGALKGNTVKPYAIAAATVTSAYLYIHHRRTQFGS